MIVNPGIRRFLGSAIQRLFNSASFYAPLTHSLVPERGTGSPSFTRATTATGQKWDEAGYLDFTALAGEVVFKGARRERNLLTTTSEDFTNAAWVKLSSGGPAVPSVSASPVSPPSGMTGNAYAVTFPAVGNAGSGAKYSVLGSPSFTAALTALVPSLYIRNPAGASTIYFYMFGAGSFTHITTVSVTTEWTRIPVTVSSAATGATKIYLGCDNSSVTMAGGIAAQTVEIYGAQLEDVTGQTTQTASEYVSVGVESAPAYHGSMVDGVKCYDTDRSGNPISTSGSYPLVGYVPWEARTNLCLQSQTLATAPWNPNSANLVVTANTTVAPDGTTTADTVTKTVGGTDQYLEQVVTTSSTDTYTLSIFIEKDSDTSRFPEFFLYSISGTSAIFTQLNTQTGAITNRSVTGTASSTVESFSSDYWRLSLNCNSETTQMVIGIRPAVGTVFGTYNTAATGAINVWGAQLELGSFATPYIPTTTVAVARNADVDQYPTTAGPIAAAGSIALDFTPYHAPSGTIALWGTYVDASNYTAILHDATNLIFRKRIAGVNYDATIANAFTSGTTYKMAASWGAGGSTIHLNGVAGTPHANTTAAQIAATMQFGADGNSLQQPGAAVIKNYIWQRQLSGSEQAAITA